MKTLIIALIHLGFLVCISSCTIDNPAINTTKGFFSEPSSAMIDSLLIQTRGGNCTSCLGSIVENCCCVVTLAQSNSIELYICGVSSDGYYNYYDCTMNTGDGCYDVDDTYGIHRSLSSATPMIYFCITKGAPFSLYNANGSGDGYIYLDCSGTGDPPGGQYGLNLSYNNGSYARYFLSDSNCDLEDCDY